MRWVALVAVLAGCGSDPATTDAAVDVAADANIAIRVETVTTSMITSGTNSQLTLVAPRAVPVGDRIVVAVQAGSMDGATSCADPRGNVYALDAQVGGGTTSGVVTLYSAVVTTEVAAGDAITATYPIFSGASTAVALRIEGLTGEPADQIVTAAANNAAPNTPSTGTTAAAAEVLLAAIGWIGPTTLVSNSPYPTVAEIHTGSGSSQRNLVFGASVASQVGEYRITATLSGAAQWTSTLVTYKGR